MTLHPGCIHTLESNHDKLRNGVRDASEQVMRLSKWRRRDRCGSKLKISPASSL